MEKYTITKTCNITVLEWKRRNVTVIIKKKGKEGCMVSAGCGKMLISDVQKFTVYINIMSSEAHPFGM